MITPGRQMAFNLKIVYGFFHFSVGQINALQRHPKQQRSIVLILLLFIFDQLYSRIRGGLVLADFSSGMSMLVNHKTAPGIHFRQVRLLHEPEEISFISSMLMNGDLFIDVGCNAGSFSLFALGSGASVVALEPNPITHQIARMNMSLNCFDANSWSLLPYAASSSIGSSWMTIHGGGTDRLLRHSEHETRNHPDCRMVETVRIDSLTDIYKRLSKGFNVLKGTSNYELFINSRQSQKNAFRHRDS